MPSKVASIQDVCVRKQMYTFSNEINLLIVDVIHLPSFHFIYAKIVEIKTYDTIGNMLYQTVCFSFHGKSNDAKKLEEFFLNEIKNFLI